MKHLEKYTTLRRVLELMKLQVADSLQYATDHSPTLTTPKEVWDWLKPQLHFEDDEKGFEDLKSMETLMERDKGYGDCDCFVVTTLAVLIVNNFSDIAIVMVGATKTAPTHIYSQVTFNGQRIILDFTNPKYNMERTSGRRGRYKYRQIVPVRWQNWF